MKASLRLMFAHGALILFVGMFSGIGLLISLLGGIELIPGHVTGLAIPGAPEVWGRAHAGGILNGMLILVVALLVTPLGFSEAKVKTLSWMLVGTGWANTVFYLAALVAPNRALTFGENRLGHANLASIIGVAPALVFAVISLVAVGMIVRQALALPKA